MTGHDSEPSVPVIEKFFPTPHPRLLLRRLQRRASQWLRDLSVRRKLSLLVGILVVDLTAVILLGILGMSLLSQVRAYVGGEGLWAKAQKDAVYSLVKYAASNREEDFQAYLGHLKIPLGDRKARLALSQPHPDLRSSDLGFLEGQNHPDDVRGMALLFLRFNRFKPIHHAIEVWGQADTVLLELQELGAAFHALSPAERARPHNSADFIRHLDELNGRLTLLENEFSLTMGEAARWARNLLEWVMVLGSLVLGFLSVLIALYFSRTIDSGLTRIGEAASRAAQGDLSAHVSLRSADELGRLAQAFNAMTESLARIDQVKGEFVATVSHELRTPLTLILAPLESLLARDYGELAGPQKAVLETMDNNARRLLQMVNGLLDFSKLQAGKMPVKRLPTDIVGLIHTVLKDLEPALNRKGLHFESDLGTARPIVEMDAYLFERILFNLMANALKFTPSGGTVSLTLDYQAPQLTLQVHDTGIGISEEDAKNLFKKFSQAEASSTRRFEGTGLGLALVKECAHLLGGEVTLKSVPGKGSLFSVRCTAPLSPLGLPPRDLPRLHRVVPQEKGLSAPSSLSAIAGPSSLPKVLIAEDNPELGAFVAALLKDICLVRLCPDGAEALIAAKEWQPDLVLSDVMMPRLDGIALTRALKANLSTAAIPVVLLTALTTQADLLRGWEAGADDYLFKPFHPRELQARVRSLLAMVAWRQRSEQQRQRQEVLEQFTRIASHDLKAPLRRIASYSGLLLRSASDKLDPASVEHLRSIADGAQQMNGLIESLLQFSRLQSGEDAFKPCDLQKTLQDVAKYLRPALEEKKAVLEIGPLPTLSAIPEQMFALFQNLISNSLKYANPDLVPNITVQAEQQGFSWVFWVTDNGLGFDPALKDEVFILFKRAHHDDEIPGDGMGLAIAKKVVELHGGRIWAEASPGQGCSLCFTLLAERT